MSNVNRRISESSVGVIRKRTFGIFRKFSSGIALSTLLCACGPLRQPLPPGEIPQQEALIPSDEQYGHEVFAELVDQYPVDTDDARINRVRSITDRLTEKLNPNQNVWHVYVLQGDDVVNAAATRGNYVFVWTGMLNTVQDDDELATVLAHEIGHVLAGHAYATPQEEANELIAGVAGMATREVLLSQGGLIGPFASLADMLVRESIKALIVNPEQQRKELEADHMGLFIMADAGYDPSVAVKFWERVQGDPRFGEVPVSFLSSHPSSTERVEELKKNLPGAIDRFQYVPGERPSSAPRPFPFDRDEPSAKGGEEIWVAQEDRIPVFQEPASSSKIVSEIRYGAKVAVSGREGRWLRITSPVSGFVRGSLLAPS